MPVRPLAVAAALRGEFRVEAEVDERVAVRIGDEIDRTAGAAIATIRSAARDELLAAEAQRPAAAVASLDVDVGFVNEHGTRRTRRKRRSRKKKTGRIGRPARLEAKKNGPRFLSQEN